MVNARESQNHRGWKKPTRSSSPTIPLSPTALTKPCPSAENLNVPWTPPGLVTAPPPWDCVGTSLVQNLNGQPKISWKTPEIPISSAPKGDSCCAE